MLVFSEFFNETMSLEELVSIERVEVQSTKQPIRETYAVTDLKLSKLFEEILYELNRDLFPVFDMRVLLYSLKSVPFTSEGEAINIIDSLESCLEFELYGKVNDWNCRAIIFRIEKLYAMILYDYVIEGSVTLFFSNQPEWDIRVSLIHKRMLRNT